MGEGERSSYDLRPLANCEVRCELGEMGELGPARGWRDVDGRRNPPRESSLERRCEDGVDMLVVLWCTCWLGGRVGQSEVGGRCTVGARQSREAVRRTRGVEGRATVRYPGCVRRIKGKPTEAEETAGKG